MQTTWCVEVVGLGDRKLLAEFDEVPTSKEFFHFINTIGVEKITSEDIEYYEEQIKLLEHKMFIIDSLLVYKLKVQSAKEYNWMVNICLYEKKIIKRRK